MARLLRRHLLKTTKATRAEASAKAWDAATEAVLIAEPARWIHHADPDWVAMEQVPAALPIFQHYGHLLRARGYSVWVGVVSAEQFGVAQTRKRAILMASRLGTVHPPEVTHQRYVHGEPAGAGADCQPDLFSPGLEPWVSMAEALGWEAGNALGFPRLDDTGTSQDGYESKPYERDTESPAPTVTGQARSWVLTDRQPHGAERHADEPAPTILASLDNGNKGWLNTNRGQDEHGNRQTRDGSAPAPAPAPALTAKAGGQWTFSENAIPLAVEEALVLQSFPADYAVAGTKTAKFRQVGNAVPPLLARAILSAIPR